ncbi:hypothetical protein ACFL2K_01025 [Candidatus Margulisiibacteriota bacterium]
MAVMTILDMDEMYDLTMGQLKPILADLVEGGKKYAGETLTPSTTQENQAKTNANELLTQLKTKVNALEAFELV